MGDAVVQSETAREDVASHEGVRSLLERAKQGDESTLPALRRLFARDRACFEGFDIAELAREAILVPLAGKNLAARELLVLRMREVTAELAGAEPMPIERLLAERAAFCWHLVNTYERTYAQAEGLSIKQAEFHQRRIDAVHRRYLSALKTLATVRKLAIPVLQINLARQQVNVSGVPATTCPTHSAPGGEEP